jgi:cyclic pyranopterin phosphate synthase
VKDRFGRELNSIRVSVTQDCNLNCFYCHREGQNGKGNKVTLDSYKKLFSLSSDIGISKVKFTGGEPLVRADIAEIVKLARQYFTDISMTTNGILLKEYARVLKEAGLNRINISLHSLNAETYKKITGSTFHSRVIEGIKAAKEAGLEPIKINYVVMKELNDNEFPDLLNFTAKEGLVLQVIELEVPRESEDLGWFKKYHKSLKEYEEYLEKSKIKVSFNPLHNRKKYFVPVNNVVAEVELVNPMHNTEFCINCHRIRFTADGQLKPCLFRDDNLTDILPYLNDSMNKEQLLEIYKAAVLKREPYWRKS